MGAPLKATWDELEERAKARAKGGARKKKVQLKSAVEYHDIRDDPYVVKPKLQIPETQSK